MSKHLKILLVVALALMVGAPAMAMKFEFHGDLNNRFLLYTDQNGFFNGGTLDDDDVNESFAEFKYRLWTTASTDDGAIKGVFAIEVGAIKYGDSSRGGAFSGDGVNVETRWFYTDFQIPSVESKARVQMGLIPFKVNKFFWSETAGGVKFYTDNWYLAWVRGRNTLNTNNAATAGNDWGDGDLDSINARYDLKMEPIKLGIFASYLWQNQNGDSPASVNDAFEIKQGAFTDSAFDLFAIGIDGGWSTPTSFGKAFVNWDFIYEGGGVDDVGAPGNDFDISAYLLHGDIGLNFGKTTVTYTIWYASGDDNATDKDLDNFMSVDVDFFDSFIFQESLTDDNVFFEGPYFKNKGLWFNKLALDYAANKQTKLGLALLYLQTAEDVEWVAGGSNFSEKDLGFEVDAYVSHKLYSNLELRVNLGYLFSGDALDSVETLPTRDGSADVDVFKSEARVRYSF